MGRPVALGRLTNQLSLPCDACYPTLVLEGVPRLLLPLALVHCLAASPARAEERLGVGVLGGAGYGTQDDGDAGSYGLAAGLKIDYRLLGWVHLGLHGIFHLGTRFDDEQNRVQLYGTEGGVVLGNEVLAFVPHLLAGLAIVESQRNVEPLLLRPYGGLGASFYMEPVQPVILALDARLVFVPAGSQQSDSVGPSGTLDVLLLAGARL